MPAFAKLAPVLLIGSLALGACGSSGTDTATNASTPATTAAASIGTSTASGSTGSTASSNGKVSANTASATEITAALTAAGVENGDAWADEVIEYRPYPADDANLTKLRDELAKYNPPAGVIDQIVGALQP